MTMRFGGFEVSVGLCWRKNVGYERLAVNARVVEIRRVPARRALHLASWHMQALYHFGFQDHVVSILL
jgi:hypothetical protein